MRWKLDSGKLPVRDVLHHSSIVAPPRPVHFGRSRRFQTVRIAAWMTREFKHHQVEDVDGKKIGRYPSNKQVERAQLVIVVGEVETSPDGGVTWHRTGEDKFITHHGPFTKNLTIDDFAEGVQDRYSWRYR